jgi:L-2-hydroxyglutarate oxidase LhgO
MADVDVTVVGAGVVGLAVAARLAAASGSLVLVEGNLRHGLETSSRNSEVIHAGMYYPPGSLKAELCVEGNHRLYEFCARHRLPHKRVSKIIALSREEDEAALEALLARGEENGARVARLSRAEVERLEPHVQSLGGIFSPDTGILSVHALMDCLLQLTRNAGAIVHLRSSLLGFERRTADYKLSLFTGERNESFTTERIVNAAGLESDAVAALKKTDAVPAKIEFLTSAIREHLTVGDAELKALIEKKAGADAILGRIRALEPA